MSTSSANLQCGRWERNRTMTPANGIRYHKAIFYVIYVRGYSRVHTTGDYRGGGIYVTNPIISVIGTLLPFPLAIVVLVDRNYAST